MKDNRGVRSIPLRSIRMEHGLLARKAELVRNEVIPYQWQVMNGEIPDADLGNAIQNFRIAAGGARGEFNGMVFQDSDVAKWLEAVAYSLATNPDERLERLADEVIELIARAQRADGYLNTYFLVAQPGKEWTNLAECHELYCAGHMLEAAVAYYQATGKRRFLDVMVRFVNLIDEEFGPEEGKLKVSRAPRDRTCFGQALQSHRRTEIPEPRQVLPR